MSHRFYLGENQKNQIEKKLASKELRIHEDTRGYFVDLNLVGIGIQNPIPEAKLIVVVGNHQFMTRSHSRTSGIYRSKGAMLDLGAVKTKTSGGAHSTIVGYEQTFVCEGSDFDNVQELILKVREGTILPKVSFENPQIKPLPVQFYDWIKLGTRIIKRDVFRFRGIY